MIKKGSYKLDTLKSPDTKDIATRIFLISVGFIGFFLIIIITNKYGIGFSQDSAGYLAAARSIANGHGISLVYDSVGDPLILWLPYRDSEPLNLLPWPPFFPLVVSVFGFMKLNIIVAAKFLIAVLFGANVFLITFIVKKYLKSTYLMVFAAIILLTSRHMIAIHSMFWSEPLFIFLSLFGFLFLIYFLEKKKILFLLIASLFFSLAFFTRTIGISLVATGAVTVLLFSGLKIKNRIIYSAISFFIGILPFSIWTLINNLNYGGSSEFIYHPFNPKNYSQILSMISIWVIPRKTPEEVRIILFSVLIAAIISIASYMAFKNRKRHPEKHFRLNSRIIGVFLFFILFYFIAFLSAKYFFDAQIRLGHDRFLLPVTIPVFIVFLFFLKRFLDFYNSREFMKIIVYVFCGFLLAISLINNNAIGLYKNGQWYNGVWWFNSPTIEHLKKIQQPQTPIYTNDPFAIYLLLGRNPNPLPKKYNTHKDKKNLNYPEELDKIIEEIKEKDGLYVYFDYGTWVFPNEKEITQNYEGHLIKDTTDGGIYKIGD